MEAITIVTDVSDVSWVLHVCYGNRYARPLWAGHYDFLFPAVQDTKETGWRWSSPARATRTCGCWISTTGTAAWDWA